MVAVVQWQSTGGSVALKPERCIGFDFQRLPAFVYFRLVTSKLLYFQLEARCSEHSVLFFFFLLSIANFFIFYLFCFRTVYTFAALCNHCSFCSEKSGRIVLPPPTQVKWYETLVSYTLDTLAPLLGPAEARQTTTHSEEKGFQLPAGVL